MNPGRELPATRRTPKWEEVAAAFVEACWSVNITPTEELIVMLLAHSAFETGHWRELRCYNFGNVKATGGWIAGGGNFCFYYASENFEPRKAEAEIAKAKPRTDGEEGLDAEFWSKRKDGRVAVKFYPSHIQARFRAFESMAAGARAYVSKLLGRYATALAWAKRGDVNRYVTELHRFGYFTAGFDGYRKAMLNVYSRYDEKRREAGGIDVSDPAERVGEEIHGTRSGTWRSE